MNLKIKSIVFMLIPLLLINSANARIFMCEDENGKKTATDSACKPTDKKRVVQMRVTELGSSSGEVSQRSKLDQKCEDLLSQMREVSPESSDTVGDIEHKVVQRKTLRYEYEARCLTSSERQTRQQSRNDEEIKNKLDNMQRVQQEIQNRQRGYGY